MEKKQKIVLVDWAWFLHSSVKHRNTMIQKKIKLEENKEFAKANKIFIMPATYTTMSKVISALSKVGLDPDTDDQVYICLEGGDNWRKIHEKAYKLDRDEKKKEDKFINWPKEYALHDVLIEKIKECTPFKVIKCHTLEADDLIATGTKFYKDKLCVIISPDKDFYQLLIRDNVRQFSPLSHKSVQKKPYRILSLDRAKEIKLAYKSLMDKVRVEKSDNLKNESQNEEENEIRLMIVRLIELPEFVEKLAMAVFEEHDKYLKHNLDLSVFSNGIQKRFMNIYNPKYQITYEQCRKKLENIEKKKLKAKEAKKKAKSKEKKKCLI